MDPLYSIDSIAFLGMFIFLLILGYLVVTDIHYEEKKKEDTEEGKENKKEKNDKYIDER
ncbi:MAG: hypothetical protein UT05_C0002G0009 [Parcubacteria group bacterium GW2011_GWF2_38_76]|nr:MAG: hypothetical protein UT05_C0002G0009 [Parcubacteria group bacterium GW2011_GWF2_38_76]